MEVFGSFVKQIFAIHLPVFGYSITFGELFVGALLLGLIIHFVFRVLE